MPPQLNDVFVGRPTTIFAVMSALANEHGAINLGQGFPDQDGPETLKKIAAEAIIKGPNQYAPTMGMPELRQAVAVANRRFYDLDVDWETQTLVTAGAAESLAAAFLGFLRPGDEAILFAPFYVSYAPMVEAAGATPVVLHLTPPDWRIDEKKLRAAITPKTKLIAINSPHNPTGQVITDSELTLLAEVIREHDLIAVCDEVYEHLIFDGLKHRPLMTLPDMTERCVRIGSAGKTCSMTGWRIGYATGPAHLIEAMAKTHQFLSYTIQPHLQVAVAQGLGFEDSYYNDFVADMQMTRDIMGDGLRRAGFNLSPAQGTYFLTVDIRDVGYDGVDMSFCKELIAKAGVAAVPISSFYMEDDPNAPKNFARFCFCKQPDVLREASARLKKYFG